MDDYNRDVTLLWEHFDTVYGNFCSCSQDSSSIFADISFTCSSLFSRCFKDLASRRPGPTTMLFVHTSQRKDSMRRFNLIIALPASLIMNMGSPQQEARAAATFTPSISTKWSTRTVAWWFLVFRSTLIYFVPAFVYQAPWVNAFSNGVVFAPLMGWSRVNTTATVMIPTKNGTTNYSIGSGSYIFSSSLS
jgi:hypothetical protein